MDNPPEAGAGSDGMTTPPPGAAAGRADLKGAKADPVVDTGADPVVDAEAAQREGAETGDSAAGDLAECEDRLRRALADCENMRKQSAQAVEARAAAEVGAVVSDLLVVRDDIERARDALAGSGADAGGLGGILHNVDALLARHGVKPVSAVGEIFDPGVHESVSVIVDADLDEGTVTRELRKGYIYRGGVIRPSLVEISQKGGKSG